MARETRFDLIYASRPERARPTSIFEAPFVQLLMRPGHFIFTLRGTPVHVAVSGRMHRAVVSYLPFFRTRTAIRSRVCKSDRVDTGERDGKTVPGKNERGEILSVYICRRRTIVGKIITVFTAERIHRRASESAPPSKVDRASFEYALCESRDFDEVKSSLTLFVVLC